MTKRVELSIYYIMLVIGLVMNTAISIREGSLPGSVVSLAIFIPTAKLWWVLTNFSEEETN